MTTTNTISERQRYELQRDQHNLVMAMLGAHKKTLEYATYEATAVFGYGQEHASQLFSHCTRHYSICFRNQNPELGREVLLFLKNCMADPKLGKFFSETDKKTLQGMLSEHERREKTLSTRL